MFFEISPVKLEKKFCCFSIISPCKKVWSFIWTKTESFLLKNALCQIWLILAQWFWKKRFFFDTVFSLFRYYIILEQGGALHLNSIVLIEIDPGVLDIRRFLNFVDLSLLSPLGKKAGPLIWTNLNPIYPWMLEPSLVEIGACGSGEEENVKS